MSLQNIPTARKRSRLLVWTGALAAAVLVTVGVFAKNGWFPSTDPFSGKKSGWFGKPLAKNASSSWNPIAPPLPDPTPQLSKEYIYAGSRLLAVEDANANLAPFADVAVFRPSTGQWWVMGGAGGSNAETVQWGQQNDRVVEGDYDGDAKTDYAVYRPSTYQWFILRSSDLSWEAVIQWGEPTDERVQADYDGDGKTDRAVWRPSDRTWYIVHSSGGYTYHPYGISTDIPAPADYDGDGKTDMALWRSSEQLIYWTRSSDGVPTHTIIGQSAGEPVSADYDGDGKDDHAVRNGNNWVIRQSSNGSIVTIPWELATDVAVQNDYDGDGKVDIATWRESSGTWHIRKSTSPGTPYVVQWGLPLDVPVPSTYRR